MSLLYKIPGVFLILLLIMQISAPAQVLSLSDPKISNFGYPTRNTFQKGYANVLGLSKPQKIRLLGKSTSGNLTMTRELAILIEIPDSNNCVYVPLPYNANFGYEPRISFYDFTGDRIPDIQISAANGGLGGVTNYLIYTFMQQKPSLLLNTTQTILPQFDAAYEPNYTARIHLVDPDATALIDLRDRRQFYNESRLYSFGRLLMQPQPKPWSGGYIKLTPVDIDKDGIYELYGVQQVHGLINPDIIATIQSILKWQDGSWKVIRAGIRKRHPVSSLNPTGKLE